jgi:hypothetical protein
VDALARERPSASLRAHAQCSHARPSARRSAQRARTHARHSARAHARTRRSARTHARRSARAPLSTRARAPLSTRARAPLRAAPHARAPLRAHALNAAAVRMCRSVPCGPCMRRKVRDRTCLGWERERNPNSPVPPLPPTPLPPPSSGRVGWRKEMQFPAGSSTGASCDRWTGRRMSAHGCRPGPRWLPARLARGGCRHGWPAAAAGTAGPRRCWHGRPAAVDGTPAAAARKWIRKCLNSDLS